MQINFMEAPLKQVPCAVKSQVAGLILSVFLLFLSIYQLICNIFQNLVNFKGAPRHYFLHTIMVSYGLSLCAIICFFLKALGKPMHLAGKPPLKRFWPVLFQFLGNFMRLIYHIKVFAPETPVSEIFIIFAWYGLYSILIFLIYRQNDFKMSGFLYLKPFVLKPILNERIFYI